MLFRSEFDGIERRCKTRPQFAASAAFSRQSEISWGTKRARVDGRPRLGVDLEREETRRLKTERSRRIPEGVIDVCVQ